MSNNVNVKRMHPMNREQQRALEVINRLRKLNRLKPASQIIVRCDSHVDPVECMLADKVLVHESGNILFSNKKDAQKHAEALKTSAELRGNRYVVTAPKSITNYRESVKKHKYQVS